MLLLSKALILMLGAVAAAAPSYLAPTEIIDFLAPGRANLVKVFLQDSGVEGLIPVMEVDTSTQVANRRKLKFEVSPTRNQQIIIDLGTEAIIKDMRINFKSNRPAEADMYTCYAPDLDTCNWKLVQQYRYKYGCRGNTPVSLNAEECTQKYSSVDLYYHGKVEGVVFKPLSTARLNLKKVVDEGHYGEINVAQFKENGHASVANREVYKKILKSEEDLQDFTRARFIRYDVKTPMATAFAYDEAGNYVGNTGFAKDSVDDLRYVEIESIQVFGHCFCNGHASSCNIQNGKFQCDCQHGTEGQSCDACAGTHGGQKWERNIADMFSSDSDLNKIDFAHTAKECKACECNGRSLICEWVESSNTNFGKSVCSCNSLYEGDTCATCKGEGLDPNDNCGSCRDGFYNYDPVKGSCTPCACIIKNTEGGTNTCDKATGQCPCQLSHLDKNETAYMGRTCNQCQTDSNPMKRNFYRVSISSPLDGGGKVQVGEVSCAPCPAWCHKSYQCTGSGKTHCVVCAPGWHRSKDEVCVTDCPLGTYPFQKHNDLQSHCHKCHKECAHGCKGEADTDCTDPRDVNPCKNYMLREGNETKCHPECPMGYFGGKDYPSECKKCHGECASISGPQHTNRNDAKGQCFGVGADECYACKNKRHNNECVSQCRPGSYADPDTNECKQCHQNCGSNCTGPSNADCSGSLICKKGHFLMDNTDFNKNMEGRLCLDKCPIGSWVQPFPQEFGGGGRCKPCDEHCSSKGCTGEGPFNCFNNECDDRYPVIITSSGHQCVENCSSPNTPTGSGPYYSACVGLGPSRCEKYECRRCHYSCKSGCSGPHSWQCSDGCREYLDETSLTLASNHSQCIPKCPRHTYISSPMAGGSELGRCRDCHPSCDECFGPHKNQCLKCKELFEVGSDTCTVDLKEKTPTEVTSDTMCVECLNGPICPADHYKKVPEQKDIGKAECKRCSNQCFYGCSGPTAKDCKIMGNHDYSNIAYPSPCTFYWMNYKNASLAECVSQCPINGYYGAIGERRCEACDQECNTCTGPGPSECRFDCKNVYSESQGKCVPSCSPDEYHDQITGVCRPCSSVCARIEGVQGSPKCFGGGPDKCYKCKHGIAKKYNSVYTCQEMDGCTFDSRYMREEQVYRGANGFPTGLMNVSVCYECNRHCDKRFGCDGPLKSECHKCKGYLYLKDNTCYNEGDEDFPTRTYKSSRKGFKNSSLTHSVLQDCHVSCNSCSGPNSDQCKGITGKEKCAEGYFLDFEDGSCKRECAPVKSFDGTTFTHLSHRFANPEARECELCSSSCESTCFTGASKCEKCAKGMYKHPDTGMCEMCYDLCEHETCSGPYAANCTNQKCKYGLTIRDIGSSMFPGGRCTHACGDEYFEPLAEGKDKCVKKCDSSANRTAIDHDYLAVTNSKSETQYIARKMCGCMKSMKVGNTDVCLADCPSGYIVLSGQGSGNSFIGRGHNGRCVCHKKYLNQCLDECPANTEYVPYDEGGKTGECRCKYYKQATPNVCDEKCDNGYKVLPGLGGCMCDKRFDNMPPVMDQNFKLHEEGCVHDCPPGFREEHLWNSETKKSDFIPTCSCMFLNNAGGNQRCVESCDANQVAGAVDGHGIRVCECKEGYYFDDTAKQCKKCNEECGAACTGPLDTECSKIVGKTLCTNFHLVKGTIDGKEYENRCLPSCPYGYQQAGNTKSCECIYEHEGECRPTCPSTHQPDKYKRTCECKYKYKDEFLPSSQTKCVEFCPSGYRPNQFNRECECKYKHIDKCVELCPPGYRPDVYKRTCECVLFHEAQQKCVDTCEKPYVANTENDKCVCDIEHYPLEKGQCGKCHDQCFQSKNAQSPQRRGCHGPGAHQCGSCKNHIMPSIKFGTECTEFCETGYAASGIDPHCKPCHVECGEEGCHMPPSENRAESNFCKNCRLYSKTFPVQHIDVNSLSYVYQTCVSDCGSTKNFVQRDQAYGAVCMEKCNPNHYVKSLWKGPGENDFYNTKNNICACGAYPGVTNVRTKVCFETAQAACHIDNGLPFCQACEKEFAVRMKNGEYFMPANWVSATTSQDLQVRASCTSSILRYTEHSNGLFNSSANQNPNNLCEPNPHIYLKQKKCTSSIVLNQKDQEYLVMIGARKTDFISDKVPVTYEEALDPTNSLGNSKFLHLLLQIRDDYDVGSDGKEDENAAPAELHALATRTVTTSASSADSDTATLGYVGAGIGGLALIVIVLGVMHIQKQKAKKRDDFEKSMNASGFGRGGNTMMVNNASYQDPSSQSIYSQSVFANSAGGYADPGNFSQQHSYAHSDAASSYSQDGLLTTNNNMMDQKAPAYDPQYQIGNDQMFQSYVGGAFDDDETGVATHL